MNLHSGLPYWLILDGLQFDLPPLSESFSTEEIVIIGSGISGALVAHELCKAGFNCIMLDRRMISTGSTVASTAHLNYELDVSLRDLVIKYGEHSATRIYESNLYAVKRVGEILAECNVDAGYENKKSLYLASDKKGMKELEAECNVRQKYNIPMELIRKETLINEYGIDRLAALRHDHAAQIDSYKASTGIIRHWIDRSKLRVYPRTEVKSLECGNDGVKISTSSGLTINAKHVVCAPGYESKMFLPKPVMKITNTYAMVTQPLADKLLWKDQPLIWETARPYIYVRGTHEGRIMIGGLDESFRDEKFRDMLLEKRRIQLLKKLTGLFPHLQNIQTDVSWCGTFGETEDGLPYIGEYPGMKGIQFALGYGGNGITFGMIAAEIICNQLRGIRDERSELFKFDR